VLDREDFRRSFAGLVADPAYLLIVAEHDTDLVVYLLAFVHGTFFANGPVVWIEEVTVQPDQRLGGTGRALVIESER
jgi:hypothetical protein